MKAEMKIIAVAASMFAIMACFAMIADESDAELHIVDNTATDQPYYDSEAELAENWCWWDEKDGKVFPVPLAGEDIKRAYYTLFQAGYKGLNQKYSIRDVNVIGFKLMGINSSQGSYNLEIININKEIKLTEDDMNKDISRPGRYVFEDAVLFSVTYTDEKGKVYTAPNLLAPFIVTKEKVSLGEQGVAYIYDGFEKKFDYVNHSDIDPKFPGLKETDFKLTGSVKATAANQATVNSVDGYKVHVILDRMNTDDRYYIDQDITWFILPKNIEDWHWELFSKVYDVGITTTPITYGQAPTVNDVTLHYYYSEYPAMANSAKCDPVPSINNIVKGIYGSYTVKGVQVTDDRSQLEVEVNGIDNYTGTRTVFIDLIPLDLNQIGAVLHVDTIHTDGSIISKTFDDSNVFLFPIDKYVDEVYPAFCRGDYQLVALSARGGTIIDEPNGITSGETASEWNYMELHAIEGSGYTGCIVGHFYEAFDGATAGIIFNAAGNQVIGYEGVSENVVIPDMNNSHKVTKIADKAFYNNKNIKSVIIGDNVTSIGMKAFAGCSKLASVTIGDSVKVISYYAFFGCKNITELDFGSKLIVVRTQAFGGLTFMDGENVLEPAAKNLVGNKFTAISKGVLALS